MTWEELKEEAKKMGLKNTVIQETYIEIDELKKESQCQHK